MVNVKYTASWSTYTRIKKIGFLGDADATTVAGEVTDPPSLGLDTVRGKSLEPFGSGGAQVDVGGVQAGGAGKGLVLGAHVIATGGVEGYDGCEGGGVVAVVFGMFEVPHPEEATAIPSAISSENRANLGVTSGAATNALI